MAQLMQRWGSMSTVPRASVPADGPGDADLLAGGRVAVAALVGKGQMPPSRIDAQPGLGPGGLKNGPGQGFRGGVLHRTGDSALETADAPLGTNNDGFHLFPLSDVIHHELSGY